MVCCLRNASVCTFWSINIFCGEDGYEYVWYIDDEKTHLVKQNGGILKYKRKIAGVICLVSTGWKFCDERIKML